ncbi:RNA polymerases k subunit family protein, putative [Ichthyophthirius multifiliis]|uniref:RNA polymerases k subunit family protein, putative n=1 Tax=Ichthyophthirius multifiliis TaxID=5932 RepID=G0QXR4_ICHMU|nr:RNA polymerases k subunit family protein, putative [Ichthyophthirius multifiliis]EGR30001.1 RNA polymerases k subunit family protein, putative [Ichthyophthirius multifiliis]|eukprot:XP_004031237.1 RNA polymerases k subunit family protein, putative [Ichthyophthirius multifiliis]
MSDYGDYYDDDNKDDEIIDDEAQSLDEDSQEIDESPEQSESEKSSSDESDEDEDKEEEDDEYEDNLLIVQQDHQKTQDSKQRVTPPFLTKYEKARIIGTRALQIAQNSPIYVDTDEKDYDPIAIAEKEFVQKKIPFIIRRYLPNKSYEDWPLDQLEVLD